MAGLDDITGIFYDPELGLIIVPTHEGPDMDYPIIEFFEELQIEPSTLRKIADKMVERSRR